MERTFLCAHDAGIEVWGEGVRVGRVNQTPRRSSLEVWIPKAGLSEERSERGQGVMILSVCNKETEQSGSPNLTGKQDVF